MAFPETPHMESDEVEFYQRQLRERIVAGHRKLNTAMVDADTNSFTSQLRQLEALRDLSNRLETHGETLGASCFYSSTATTEYRSIRGTVVSGSATSRRPWRAGSSRRSRRGPKK